MEYDWEGLKAKLKVNDVTPTKVMTVTREDLVSKPQVIGNSSAGIYPVREQMFNVPSVRKSKTELSAIVADVLETYPPMDPSVPGKVKACIDSFLESGMENHFRDKEESREVGRGMTSSVVHVDELPYELPMGKPGQVLAHGENGSDWIDPPSK